MSEKVYLRWGDKRNRADEIARRLGYELVSVQWHLPSSLLRPLRPLVLYWRTKAALRRLKPKAIISHHTQPFGSVACVRYGKRHGVPVVTDCHNGPFVDPLWQRFPFRQAHRYALRHAAVNLVHNEPFRGYVAQQHNQGRFLVLHDCIPNIADRVQRASLAARPVVLVVCSWSADEPVGEVVAAARNSPEIDYWVTGRVREARLRGAGEVPENVRFMGFVSDADYDRTLRSADAALVLSTREHVLTCACHEAIGAECALVISDSAAARGYLRAGTVFIDNNGDSIAAGVRTAVRDRDRLRAEMVTLRGELDAVWEQQARVLQEMLDSG
ncbi:MAG: glycosyltransferase [Planctomycetota bacterium]